MIFKCGRKVINAVGKKNILKCFSHTFVTRDLIIPQSPKTLNSHTLAYIPLFYASFWSRLILLRKVMIDCILYTKPWILYFIGDIQDFHTTIFADLSWNFTVHPQGLSECLAHIKCSKTVCWMGEFVLEYYLAHCLWTYNMWINRRHL